MTDQGRSPRRQARMHRAYALDVLTRYRNAPGRYLVEEDELDVNILTLSLTASADPEGGFGRLQCLKRELADGRTVLVPWPEDFDQLSNQDRHHWASFEIANPQFAAPDNDLAYIKSARQSMLGLFVDLPGRGREARGTGDGEGS